MNLAEINQEMSSLKNWSFETDSISKSFLFGNFKEAIEFINKVAEIADRMNHHPDIFVSYNRVRLNLMTHHEKSITKKDFEVARKIDGLENSS